MNIFSTLFRTWFILIVLTVISVLLSEYFQLALSQKTVFIISVMLIVAIKGQQIIDIFMELSDAPRKWRLLLLSYVIIIPSAIMFIYTW